MQDMKVTTSQGPIHQLGADRAYFLFLTHLQTATKQRLAWPVQTVSEIGTGTSLGLGNCSILAGAERYQGLDGFDHLNRADHWPLLEQLIGYFQKRAPATLGNGGQSIACPQNMIANEILENSLSQPFFNSAANGSEGLSQRSSIAALPLYGSLPRAL
ncbi:MAG: hypothetical protein OIF40_00520 [Mangrovicoccus sp.]|nr:hypothetical protein [Mangrovicoccus sp.]